MAEKKQVKKKAGRSKKTPASSRAKRPRSMAKASPASAGNFSVGQRVYKEIPQLSRMRDDVLYGDVWRQSELGPRDRSMVTCAVLAALGRQEELAFHVQRAVENGITKDELRGMAVHIAFYAGWPAGLALGKAILPLLEDKN